MVLATLAALGVITPQTQLKAVAVPHLLVGSAKVPFERIVNTLDGLATIKPVGSDGFAELTLNDEKFRVVIKQKLAKLGNVNIHNPGARRVDQSSLHSVRSHISYMRDSLKLRGLSDEGESGVDFYEALEFYLQNRVGPDGRINRDDIKRAIAQRDALPPAQLSDPRLRIATSAFSNIGPKNTSTPYPIYMSNGPISGRKNGIAIAPSNPNIIWVASAGGGAYKSIDGGVTWTAMFDKQAMLHTNCVAIDPTNPNIVYVGTGDYRGFFTAQTQGVLKTTDGGINWTAVGDNGDLRYRVVSRLIIDPATPSNIVITTGKDGNNDSYIYRSTNSGATFTQVNAPAANWDDMEIGIDGSYWAVATLPNTGGGIFRSTNKGATWTQLNNPVVSAQPALEIGLSKVAAGRAYLLATGDKKIYKTTDFGSTWTDVTGNFPMGTNENAEYNWSQRDYDYHIGCSKDGSTDLVFVGLITLAMSRGGTGTWTDIGRAYQETAPNNIHSDQHCMAVSPASSNIVYFGCDGGIWRYDYNPGTQSGTFASLNGQLGDFQFYEMSVFGGDDLNLNGGCQDNASPSVRGSFINWKGLYAGDGGWSGFDPTNNGVNFVSSQNCSIFRYTSLADHEPDYITPDTQGFQPAFIAPIIYAGTNGQQLFCADRFLYRWSGTARTWTKFPTQLSNDPLLELVAAPSNKNVIYTGGRDGIVGRTPNAGTSFTGIGPVGVTRPIGAIDVAWANANDVIIGYQGPSDGTSRLLRTTNASVAVPTWVSISGSGGSSLPDIPINAVARDPYDTRRFYVGTDIGLFMTTNSGATWTNMSNLGFPNVHVNSIKFNGPKTLMYVATFGKGVYRISIGQTAAFSISGTARANGLALQGVSMRLTKLQNTFTKVSNNSTFPIPDFDQNGVVIPLNVGFNQKITRVVLGLEAVHAFPQDLVITLHDPRNQGVWVWNQQPGAGGIAANFTYADFNGKPSNGNWMLWAKDVFFGDQGAITKCELTIYYDAYKTVTAVVTGANGTYQFTNLAPAFYRIYPSMTGQTFNPAVRAVTVGPSRTDQDFTRN